MTSNHPSFMPLVAVGSCSSVAEHWHGKPKVLGSIPSSSTFLSSPFFSHSKGLWTVVASLRSLIRPSLISSRTKLIGVPTNGLPAVTKLEILLNQQSTRSYYPHSTVKTWLNSAVGCKPHKVLVRGVDNIDITDKLCGTISRQQLVRCLQICCRFLARTWAVGKSVTAQTQCPAVVYGMRRSLWQVVQEDITIYSVHSMQCIEMDYWIVVMWPSSL